VYYAIAGGDLAARFGRTQIRMEYLLRQQSFEADPMLMFKQPVPASGRQVFDKHGAYLEVERSMTDTIGLYARVDGLYRVGNVPISSALDPRSTLEPKSAILRYTAGGTVAVWQGWRLKTSAELWSFSNDVPTHWDFELGFHLAVVGTF
jgi:hypothetical protein